MQEYNVEFFIKKFSAIPEDKWCVDIMYSTVSDRRCALGWCCNLVGDEFKLEEEFAAITNLFRGVNTTQNLERPDRYTFNGVNLFNQQNCFVPPINNGDTNEYKQSTPKARMLAALEDIKKLQLKSLLEEYKEKVSIPEIKSFERNESLMLAEELIEM